MSFVGDKGRNIYLTFQWEIVQVGSGESAQNVNEKEIFHRVVGKFKAHLEAKKNPIMAAVKFDRRRQLQGETFDSFVTDLKLLACGLDMRVSNNLIRNAIACKSLDERTLQEIVYPGEDFSSDEEGSNSNVQLLHIAILEMNGIRDRQKPQASSTQCPDQKNKKTLVSYSQQRITPKGYVTLPIRFKDRDLNVNFYVIDSKQKPILSGKVCQALNLVQQKTKKKKNKPLEMILRKPMATTPLRLHAMMLKVSGYDLKVEYLPGKKQVLADTLSRQKEPLLPSSVPDLPWEMAASDIFTFEGEHYLLLVDYYIKFIEVTRLKDLTSQVTIGVLKEHFSQHGIPAKLVTDCGSKYTNNKFETFAKRPTEVKVRNKSIVMAMIKARMKHSKDKQKYYHDCQGANELPPLKSGYYVRVKPEPRSKEWRAATIVQKHALPRSYVVEMGGQRIRHNRIALRNDSTKSHMGYLKRQGNIAQQTEPELDKSNAGLTFPASLQMESSLQGFHLSPSAAEEIPAEDVPPSWDVMNGNTTGHYSQLFLAYSQKMMGGGTGSSTTSSSQASPAATFVPLLDVGSLTPFNPKEDPNTLSVHWKLWKRSFNLYLVAKGITKDEHKTALLLHTGGLNLQDLYYTLLTGADIKPFAEYGVVG
ncbi:Uncharacterized protein K02A2.6 [Stylophora pistillata]|uniref:Uncharacterized protein K02A2.6 n=1 Tax=Stylophora pistillata TaxID=50429 RepID=A0A2B4R638_STYPI|nr:Uncharacterized protein K02A2.6 [Stylophora pistillata]